MRVMVIVNANSESEAGQPPSEELLAAMLKFNDELIKAGVMKDAAGLHPSAAGKRVTFSGSTRRVIDGPFAETKELIAGYWIWDVSSMEEALAWLERCPNPANSLDGVIEIRPMFENGECGKAASPELKAEFDRQQADFARQLSA
jgi:hypothetical protein